MPALSKAKAGGAEIAVGEEGADTGGGELLDGIAEVVRDKEIARVVKGQAVGIGAGVGEDRADAARRELLDRVVAVVGRIEVARAVEGQALAGRSDPCWRRPSRRRPA